MVTFSGLCTYPHGGRATAGLFIATACALAAGCYGIASCRLFVLSFQSSSADSTSGSCFEQYFQVHSDIQSGNSFSGNATTSDISCQVGFGLFQWLRPNDITSNNWQDGYCVGYQQSMLEAFAHDDVLFDVTRGLGIFNLLMSFVLLGWSFFMSCLKMNWMQMLLLRMCLGAVSVTSGLLFLLKKTDACTNMFGSATECILDQGGLAVITACILWCIAFMVTCVFMEASTSHPCGSWRQRDKQLPNGSGTPKMGIGSYSFDSTESWTQPVQRKDVTVDIAPNQDEMELYIKGSLDKIEFLAGDDEESNENVGRARKKGIAEAKVT